jgi:tetratricopeptide (TPR) repeat protein
MNPTRDHWFALLAVEQEMVRLEDLAPVWNAWLADSGDSLAAYLIREHLIDESQRASLDALVDRHQAKEGRPFPERFLRALEAAGNLDTIAGLALPPTPHLPATLVGPVAAPLSPQSPSDTRYQRLHLHATGGLGQVWFARDTQLDREVALKELRPEIRGDAELSRRFVMEAKITGQLEHPGIVPIYELASASGCPTYAMRFLKGRTLTDAIRQAKTVGERLKLLPAFATICQTIAYAHSRGIIHRDLKGANVLLGDFGEVIVLDWGLAKPIDAKEGASVTHQAKGHSPEGTQAGQILGTPFYMPPEQAAGQLDQIGFESDVYSLGAILYEILTGVPPFGDLWAAWNSTEAHAATLERLLKTMRESAPTRPRQLDRSVPAALEAVCLKAVAKQPSERYAQASELAAEIQRWLADEPVAAFSDPWNVRIGRWARKHRTLATSAAVFLMVTIIGLTTAALLINQERDRTREALHRAEGNLRKAQDAVDRFFVQVSEDKLLDQAGLQPLRRDLLATAGGFFAAFAKENADDPQLRAAVGDTLLRLAKVSSELGDNEKARSHFEDAQKVFEQLSKAEPSNADFRWKLARCELGVGYRMFLAAGWSNEVGRRLDSARSRLEKLVQENPQPDYRSELANVLNTTSILYQRSDAIAPGPDRDRRIRELLGETLRLWKELASEEPTVNRISDLAGAQTNLGVFLLAKGDRMEAINMLSDGVALRRKLVLDHPKSLEQAERLSMALANLGSAYRVAGQPDRAETHLREALEAAANLVRRNPFVEKFQADLALAHYNLGHNELIRIPGAANREKVADAGEASLKEAATIYGRLADEHPTELPNRMMHGAALAAIGHLRYEIKMADAVPWYDKAIPILRQVIQDGDSNPETRKALANSCWGRAEFRSKTKQWAKALEDWDEAIRFASAADRQNLVQGRASTRIQYAQSATLEGRWQIAVEQADALKGEPVSALQCFDLARMMALNTKDAADAKAKHIEEVASRAVLWLRRGMESSPEKDPTRLRAIEVFRSLPVLAERSDFKAAVPR